MSHDPKIMSSQVKGQCRSEQGALVYIRLFIRLGQIKKIICPLYVPTRVLLYFRVLIRVSLYTMDLIRVPPYINCPHQSARLHQLPPSGSPLNQLSRLPVRVPVPPYINSSIKSAPYVNVSFRVPPYINFPARPAHGLLHSQRSEGGTTKIWIRGTACLSTPHRSRSGKEAEE